MEIQERAMADDGGRRTKGYVLSSSSEKERRREANGIRQRPDRMLGETQYSSKTGLTFRSDVFKFPPTANTENGTHDWKWMGEAVGAQNIDGGQRLLPFVNNW